MMETNNRKTGRCPIKLSFLLKPEFIIVIISRDLRIEGFMVNTLPAATVSTYLLPSEICLCFGEAWRQQQQRQTHLQPGDRGRCEHAPGSHEYCPFSGVRGGDVSLRGSALRRNNRTTPQQVIGPVNHPVGALWSRDSSPCLGLKWAVCCCRETLVFYQAASQPGDATSQLFFCMWWGVSALSEEPQTEEI